MAKRLRKNTQVSFWVLCNWAPPKHHTSYIRRSLGPSTCQPTHESCFACSISPGSSPPLSHQCANYLNCTAPCPPTALQDWSSRMASGPIGGYPQFPHEPSSSVSDFNFGLESKTNSNKCRVASGRGRLCIQFRYAAS
jgi:hypothetical protein